MFWAFFAAFIFLVLAFVFIVRKKPNDYGKYGETLVSRANGLAFGRDKYKAFDNVTLALKDGSTTQIDHILVSCYGVFVIETKHIKGVIKGSHEAKTWSREHKGSSHEFQNPLLQNYRHIKALAEVTGAPLDLFESVVVFLGEGSFAFREPPNVFRGGAYIEYIRSFKDKKINPKELKAISESIKSKSLKQGAKTDKIHLKNLKSRGY